MKNKITLMLTLLLAIFYTQTFFAQDGTNDVTFNPTDTGFSNGADGPINAVAIQPDGKMLIVGSFKRYLTQISAGIARLNSDQSLDTTFKVGTGTSNPVTTIALQPDGKILIAGNFTFYNNILSNKIARLNSDGSFDDTFFVNAVNNSESISKILLQKDGKLLVAYSTAVAPAIIRLNTDGSVDNSFKVPVIDGSKMADIVLEPDGKIVAVGTFNNINNVPHKNIVRLAANGSVDDTFNADFPSEAYAIALQNDNKIIVTGFRTQFLNGIMRFNSDGSIDDSFVNIQNNSPKTINDVAVQSNGKIVIVGNSIFSRLNADGTFDDSFTTVNTNSFSSTNSLTLLADSKIILAGDFLLYNGLTTNYIAKFNVDGSLDASFSMGNGTGANHSVFKMVNQGDDKIVMVGAFTYYNGIARNHIARIAKNGLIDESFNPGTGPSGSVSFVKAVANGKFIIGGSFTSYNGSVANQVARINSDGSLDTTFSTGTGFPNSQNFGPTAMDVQPDGKILLASSLFTTYNNIPCAQIIRLNTDGSLDTTFNTALFPYEEYRDITKIIVLPDEQKILIGSSDYFSAAVKAVVKVNYDGTPDENFAPITEKILIDVIEMEVQLDGKIIVYGYYTENGTDFIYKFLRFNKNGGPDITFAEGEITNDFYVSAVYPLPDGKIVVAGAIHHLNPLLTGTIGVIRLNNNGTLDGTFESQVINSNFINAIVPQQNKLVIAGDFTSYANYGRNRIARLVNKSTLDVKTPVATNESVMVYNNNNNNNTLTITSSNKNINSVAVYDLLGRLVASKNAINVATTQFKDLHLSSTVLIVNTTLDDGNTVSKKIYY